MFPCLYGGGQPLSLLIFTGTNLGFIHLQHLHSQPLFLFIVVSGWKHHNLMCLSIRRPRITLRPTPRQAPITEPLCWPLLKLGIWRHKQLIITPEKAFSSFFLISVTDVTFRAALIGVGAITKNYRLPLSKPVIITRAMCESPGLPLTQQYSSFIEDTDDCFSSLWLDPSLCFSAFIPGIPHSKLCLLALF